MAATIYRIHPGIGIARLGNSPLEFYIAPEKPAALPTACDARGNPLLSPDGESELPVERFKDDEGRIKRQAARFQVWAYDDDSPEGRPLRLGDEIAGGGNAGTLVDIQWRVYLANKKASWYTFEQLEGEHGYASDHPRRNPTIVASEARQRLIIDPGPRIVDHGERRTARFDRDAAGLYATTFPPALKPASIDTLGELKTDDHGRLLVLGGHGHSGSFLFDQFGQPRIDHYANNDGWFDDTSDGPVMARLVMFSHRVDQVRFIDVEYPAWVLVGYPAYVPEVLDMVTTDDVIYDLGIRQFATRPELYGEAGTWNEPERIAPTDAAALTHWRAGRLEWNPEYRPWFYRDVWPILFRPDEFTWLTNVLAQSNFPHNQSPRGAFDPYRLGLPPVVDHRAVRRCMRGCMKRHHDGRLFAEALADYLVLLEKQAGALLRRGLGAGAGETEPAALESAAKRLMAPLGDDDLLDRFAHAAGTFAHAAHERPRGSFWGYLRRWRRKHEESSPEYVAARREFEDELDRLLDELEPARSEATEAVEAARARRDDAEAAVEEVFQSLRDAVRDRVRLFYLGRLLERCRARCVATHTRDEQRPYRSYLFDLIRRAGEENDFRLHTKAASRTHNLPLMPLLAGDNPISNTLPSKFLRLTEYQFFILRQWARGLFHNEELEGWGTPDPWEPYAHWRNDTGHRLDRGVLSNLLGGAFCPGGEMGWIQRNPSVYREPYRLKADPDFYAFRQTAAQASNNRGQVPDAEYSAYTGVALSQDNDYDRGLQPGDLTKSMALPWQADFNECTTQTIDVTYELWNDIFPASDGDSRMAREQQSWETLWWPAHRPTQVFVPPTMRAVDWSQGIQGTLAGDLAMVSEWWKLRFVRQNPALAEPIEPSEMPPDPIKYIGVEGSEDD